LDLFHNIILFTRQQSLTAESLNVAFTRQQSLTAESLGNNPSPQNQQSLTAESLGRLSSRSPVPAARLPAGPAGGYHDDPMTMTLSDPTSEAPDGHGHGSTWQLEHSQ
jgi:hypothetical protein